MDGVGLDTVALIEDNYIKERGLPSFPVEWLRKNYISQGKLGAKSGNGGLYPAGYTIKKGAVSQHDNLTAPTLYVVDVGAGGNAASNFFSSGKIYIPRPQMAKTCGSWLTTFPCRMALISACLKVACSGATWVSRLQMMEPLSLQTLMARTAKS